MEHAEHSLQYAIYELRLAFIELALILTESLPKPLRFICAYFNVLQHDTQRSFAEYINEFY